MSRIERTGDESPSNTSEQPRRITCVGGAVLDRKYRATRPLVFATSNPVEGHRSYGGVARNVAENLARLGEQVAFVSVVGDDDGGRGLLAHLAALGVETLHVATTAERPTAEYAAILSPEHELVLGIADMAIFDLLDGTVVADARPVLSGSDWVFMDCNCPPAAQAALFAGKEAAGFRLAVDTVSTPKALRLPADLSPVDVLFTNVDEANALLGCGPGDRLDAAAAAASLRDRGARSVVVTMGAKGCVVASPAGVTACAAVPAEPADITGAGDAMIAGTLHAMLRGAALERAVTTGALVAALTVESAASVRPDLSPALLAQSGVRADVLGEA